MAYAVINEQGIGDAETSFLLNENEEDAFENAEENKEKNKK